MNPPDAPPAGDPEPVRTGRPRRRPAPEQRCAPPEEIAPGESSDTDGGSDGTPAGAPAENPTDGLTDRERRILAFERQWWKHAGAKEQAIRDSFGLSATRYYQLLNNLLDNPAALAAEPQLVGRLRRLRATRARNRRR